MSSIFSAISGHFGRAIIIGAVLPATVFILIAYLFVLPMLPWRLEFVADLASLDAQWTATALLGAVVVVAGLLHALNTSIVRWYEGYPWERGILGKRLTARQQRHLQKAVAGRVGSFDIRRALSPADVELKRRLQSVQTRSASTIFGDFPIAGSVLPTRLGNTIRSFENYPRLQYGIWGVTLFPRFVAKIPKEYAALIDDAKTMFDVLIHLSFLSFLLALMTLVIGCIYPIAFASQGLLWRWLSAMAVEVIAALLLYSWATERAKEWGDLVRSAFDLYRWQVLRDLGFAQMPASLDDERQLWNAISRQLAYGDPLDGTRLRYDGRVTPSLPALVVTRGIENASGTSDQKLITLRVENRGTAPAADVVVTEEVPNNREYVWDSARGHGNAPVAASGTNPYRFALGTIAPGSDVTITYRVLEQKK